jgi:hypothetical protein
VTVNVGLLPAEMWLSAGSASSALVPTLTDFNRLPWWPGATLEEEEELDDWPVTRDSTVLASSQPTFGTKRVALVLRPCTPLAASVCWISGATRCE